MAHYKKLIGDKCFLSPLSVEDFDIWSQCFNIPPGEAKEEVEKRQKQMDSTFAIVEGNSAVGYINLENINHIYQNSNISLKLKDPVYLKNGIGVEAIKLILDLAFNCLNLHSVSITLGAHEKEQLSCYIESGFKESARRRESLLVNNEYVDEVFLDTLSTEYKSVYVNRILDSMNSYQV